MVTIEEQKNKASEVDEHVERCDSPGDSFSSRFFRKNPTDSDHLDTSSSTSRTRGSETQNGRWTDSFRPIASFRITASCREPPFIDRCSLHAPLLLLCSLWLGHPLRRIRCQYVRTKPGIANHQQVSYELRLITSQQDTSSLH